MKRPPRGRRKRGALFGPKAPGARFSFDNAGSILLYNGKLAVATQPRAVEAPSIRRRDDNGPTITLRAIPRELWRELNLRSVEENTTVRALVLQALRDQGYSVPDGELEDKRKNNGARRS